MKKILLTCLLATGAFFAKAQNDLAVVNNTNCLVSLYVYEDDGSGTCTTNPPMLLHVPAGPGVTICTSWFTNQVIKVVADDGSLTANPPCNIISPKPTNPTATVDLCGGATTAMYSPSTTCTICSGPITVSIASTTNPLCTSSSTEVQIN